LAHSLHCIVHNLVQVNRLNLEMDFAGYDSAHIEKVIDDLNLQSNIPLARFEPALVVLRSCPAFAQQSGPTLYGMQRRA